MLEAHAYNFLMLQPTLVYTGSTQKFCRRNFLMGLHAAGPPSFPSFKTTNTVKKNEKVAYFL